MRKAVIFNKKVFIILLIVLAISMAISMSMTGAGSSKADADNQENITSQPVSQPKLLTEEEVIERAEKIIAELETTMPVVNKVPRMIWSDKDKQSFQDGYYTIVPNDAIIEEVFYRFGSRASTSREADIIRKHLKRLPGFVYDSSTGRYVNDETGIWYIIENGQRVLPAEEYYDTNRIVVLSQYIKIEPRPVEAFKLIQYEKVKVENGDTFNGIVARFYPLQPRLDKEYLKNEIMRLNGIKDSNYIKAGDILMIPIYEDVNDI